MGFIFTTSPASCTVCAHCLSLSLPRAARRPTSPRLFRVAQHEQSLMTKSRSSFWRRAAARIRDDQVVAVVATLCLPRFLRLWTNRASSMACRQATGSFSLGGRKHPTSAGKGDKTLTMRGGPAEPPPVSFLPPSQKAKRRKEATS